MMAHRYNPEIERYGVLSALSDKDRRAYEKRRREQLYAIYQANLARQRGEIVSCSYVIGQSAEYNRATRQMEATSEPLFTFTA